MKRLILFYFFLKLFIAVKSLLAAGPSQFEF